MKPLIDPINTDDGQFHARDNQTGELATIVTPVYMNDTQGATRSMQREVISILTAAGIRPADATNDQLLNALKSLFLPADDSRVSGALQKDKNLSDLTDSAKAREALSLDKVGNWVAVQQGGGAGMKDNKVCLGWDGQHFIGQVDATELGKIFCDLFPPTPEDCNAFPAEGGSVGSKGVSSKGDIKADGSNIITRGGAYYIQNSDGVNIAIISASSGGTIEIKPLTGTAVVNTQAELREYEERVYSPNNPPPYPVTSINGATGAVTTATANLAGGWHKDAATGLITQWGFTQNSSTNEETHSFNIAFPNVCTCIVATLGTGINNGNTVTANAINAQQFNCRTSGQLLGFHWLAIGY